MSTLVRANLTGAQKQQKSYGDWVKEQPLEVGDEVLVLLPKKQNKLQLQWSGPTRKITPVDCVNCEVKRLSQSQEKKIYHVNLLKKPVPVL